MKALYAFEKAKSSDYHLAKTKVEEHFEPDYAAPEPPDFEKLENEKSIAIKLFESNFHDLKPVFAGDEPVTIKKIALEAIQEYHHLVNKDLRSIRSNMLLDAENLFVRYVGFLKLITLLADYVDTDHRLKKEKQIMFTPVFPHQLKFFSNRVIEQIRRCERVQKISADNRIGWDEDQIHNWYRLMKKFEPYHKYTEKTSAEFEDDREIVELIFRDLIFREDVFTDVLGEDDIEWQENKGVLRNMVLKSVKGAEVDKAFDLYLLSKNWEDDRDFFKELFDSTLEHQQEVEQLIEPKLKNWELDRVAELDIIIIKMAVAEMIEFPSIPVKVSINEYLEVTKNYSTPKSKDFVNGILDAISSELVKSGKIKKSGRGLLDNK